MARRRRFMIIDYEKVFRELQNSLKFRTRKSPEYSLRFRIGKLPKKRSKKG